MTAGRGATWILVLIVSALMACAHRSRSVPVPLTDPAGAWEGSVSIDEATLSLTVGLERTPSGWRGTVDLPSQYALGYPLTDVVVEGGRVGFAFPDVLPPSGFEGTLERGRIRGRFTGAAAAAGDTLRGTFELRPRRPDPVPYASEEVRFRNGEIELAGSLYVPRPPGRRPAVVFVHGSGPQTRDSYLRYFADRFARAGFVTLFYDKRGTGESGGERWPQTPGSFVDLAADAVAALDLLRARPDVDPARVGIWGLSQGAWIAPLVASSAPDPVGYLILVSGGGVTPAEQELYDDEVKLRDLGFDEEAIAAALAYLRLADAYVRSPSDASWDRFAAARERARGEPWYPSLDRFPQILPREAPVWEGLRTDLDYDPAPTLAALRVPVLLILGAEDRSTPAEETTARVRSALDGAVTVRLLPGADHALLVKPGPDSPWLAERPADDWVSEMIEWAGEAR